MTLFAARFQFISKADRSLGRAFSLLALFVAIIFQAGCLGTIHSPGKLSDNWSPGKDKKIPKGASEKSNCLVTESELDAEPDAKESASQPSEAAVLAANSLLATSTTQDSTSSLRPTQETTQGWHCSAEPPIHLCLFHRHPRWRHRGLLQILAEHPRPVEILQAGQYSTDPEVAATAIIGLARLNEEAAAARQSRQEILSHLLGVCQNKKLAITTRAAAWESLGNLSWPEAADAVNQQWDSIPEIEKALDWEIRERWIARAKHHPPRQDARLQKAIASADAPMQALILDLMFDADEMPLTPTTRKALTSDSPETLRKRGLYLPYLRTAAPLEQLSTAIGSPEFTVREAAILGLGREGSSEARAFLDAIDDEAPTLIGVAATNAWGVAGDQAKLLQKARHKSYRVRRVVTQWLEPPSNPQETEVVVGLLTDSQRDVHLGMLERVQTWPDNISRPLLEEAANRTSKVSRQRSDEFRKLLATRELSVTAPSALEITDNQSPSKPSEHTYDSDSTGPPLSSEQAIKIMGWIDQLETSTDSNVREQAKQRLLEAGHTVLQVLQQYAEPLNDFRPTRLEREILPQIDPVFRSTSQLSIPPDAATADALRKLRAQVDQRELPNLAICQLLDFAQGTNDPGVWNELLVIIERDNRVNSREISNLALTHENPHIRRQACSYFLSHYDSSYRQNLEKLLHDQVATVRQAAVEALAQEDDPTIHLRLIERLADTDAEVRLAAAAGLAKHNQVEGYDALRRMTYLRSEPVRLKTARAIAELSDPSWVPTLIRLLDDSTAVRGVALESLPHLVADPELIAQLTATRSTLEKVQIWKQWSEENQVVEATASPTPDNR